MKHALNKRRWFAALGAMALLASTIVAFSAIEASGSDPSVPASTALTGPVGTDGIVRLHLGDHGGSNGDYLRYDAATYNPGTDSYSFSPGTQKNITTANCVATYSGLMSPSVTPTNNTNPGLSDHSLGVKTKAEGVGVPCGRIDGTSQSLTLTRTNAEPLTGKLFDYAELDLEFKFGASAVVTLLRNGSTVGGPYTIANPGPDSNPDNAASDNKRVAVPPSGTVLFDAVRIGVSAATPGGAVSLEGGNDWANTPVPASDSPLSAALGTADSVFRVTNADGTINCGGTASEGINTLERVSNTGETTCTPVTYGLSSGTSGSDAFSQFLKDLTTQPGARFFWTVQWPAEPAVYPLPATLIDEFDGNGAQTAVWCAADGIDTDSYPEVPSGRSWCIVEEKGVQQADTGLVKVTTKFFGSGDPRSLR